MRALFLVSFSLSNIITLDVVPITNEDYVKNVISEHKKEIATWQKKNRVWDDVEAALKLNLISIKDVWASVEKPDDTHKNATWSKAKGMCDGGNVRWMEDVMAEAQAA